MPITKPPYPAQFREQMIELVRAGRSANALAREFGCHATTIAGWVRQAGVNVAVQPVGEALSADERKELVELRKKLRRVEEERDILAKATAWFANKDEQTFKPSTR